MTDDEIKKHCYGAFSLDDLNNEDVVLVLGFVRRIEAQARAEERERCIQAIRGAGTNNPVISFDRTIEAIREIRVIK